MAFHLSGTFSSRCTSSDCPLSVSPISSQIKILWHRCIPKCQSFRYRIYSNIYNMKNKTVCYKLECKSFLQFLLSLEHGQSLERVYKVQVVVNSDTIVRKFNPGTKIFTCKLSSAKGVVVKPRLNMLISIPAISQNR